jgi:hypothetical protein
MIYSTIKDEKQCCRWRFNFAVKVSVLSINTDVNTQKTLHHDIAEILLKLANTNQSINQPKTLVSY